MIQLMMVNHRAFTIKMVGMIFSVVFWLDNCPPMKYPTEMPKSVTEIITAQEMVVAPKKEASIRGAIISTAKLANPAKKTSEKIIFLFKFILYFLVKSRGGVNCVPRRGFDLVMQVSAS